LYYAARFRNGDFRNLFPVGGMRITPTYLQGELTFDLDDYGKKESITVGISGSIYEHFSYGSTGLPFLFHFSAS